MTFVDFLAEGDLISLFLKLFGVTLGLLYFFFSIIMVKQVSNMKKTVVVHDNGLLNMAAYIQLGLAALVVFFAIFLL